METQGLEPYFRLRGMQIKPMNAPEPGVVISVTGRRYGGRDPLQWIAKFPSGYHLPYPANLTGWDYLEEVEIVADFGEDQLDWEFCMDDLEISFENIVDRNTRPNDRLAQPETLYLEVQ
jgi:hypothetical protein